MDAIQMLDGGRFLTMEDDPDRDGPWPRELRMWASPGADAPTWSRNDLELSALPAAQSGLLAAGVWERRIVLLDVESGATVGYIPGEHGPFAWIRGEQGPLLVACQPPDAGRRMVAYEVRAGSPPRVVWTTPIRDWGALFPSHDGGQLIAMAGLGRLERRDSRTGALLGTLSLGGQTWTAALTHLPDGACIAYLRGAGAALARWEARADWSSGFWGWLSGGVAADHVIETRTSWYGLVPTPDGELALMGQGAVAACSARTLGTRCSFNPAGGSMGSWLAFTADDRALVATSAGLAVWPWRELMGRP